MTSITQVNDPTGTYAFTFDNMGRLTGTTTSYSFLDRAEFHDCIRLRQGLEPHRLHRSGKRLDDLRLRHVEPLEHADAAFGVHYGQFWL